MLNRRERLSSLRKHVRRKQLTTWSDGKPMRPKPTLNNPEPRHFMSEKTFNIYETNNRGEKNYIGSITAVNKSQAIDKAHDKYGAPIEVNHE